MAKIVIGEETIEVSLANFKQLKKAWPSILIAQSMVGASNMMDGADAILQIVSDFGNPAHPLDVLEEKLLPAQTIKLASFLNDLMVEAGLAKRAGEEEPTGETASPSTAISEA